MLTNYLINSIRRAFEKNDLNFENYKDDILRQYGDSTYSLDDDLIDLSESGSELRNLLKPDQVHYFTISSREDFTNLPSLTAGITEDKSIVFTPLNNHSRDFLHKGDILFCYRQGQFNSLDSALETRGIYAVGIAATDPMLLFPQKSDHQMWGVVVFFPAALQTHLELRNIQLHPNTINLTPYNGNRNDALQHIEDETHYSTLLSLISHNNFTFTQFIQSYLNTELVDVAFPDNVWSDLVMRDFKTTPYNVKGESIDFDTDQFIKDLENSGLFFEKGFIIRFIASLVSKPFLILTGLSGSGKTQLALSFAKWISGTRNSELNLLQQVTLENDFKDKYNVLKLNHDLLEITNKNGKNTIIPLPTELIYEWFHAFKEGLLTLQDDPKYKRDIFINQSKYQQQMHSFYSDLFRISKRMYELDGNQNIFSEINQYEIIPVGADWLNRDPLLGYPNALNNKYEFPPNGLLKLLLNAKNYPHLPFFLILDEMNMSHVERYFADFLSALESQEEIVLHHEDGSQANVPSKISIPANFFIIGTVNIDETTYMFSPKVLDRAHTLEFRVTEESMKHFLNSQKEFDSTKLSSKGKSMAENFVKLTMRNDEVIFESSVLISVFRELEKVNAEFGFRSASEIKRLISKLSTLAPNMTMNEIIDIAIMHKLLPKLHGSKRKINPVLLNLGRLCIEESPSIHTVEELFSNPDFDFSETVVKYPLTLDKLRRMYSNSMNYGYTSYAEA